MLKRWMFALILTGLSLPTAGRAGAEDDRTACFRDFGRPREDALACDRLLQQTDMTPEQRAELLVAKAQRLFRAGAIPQSDQAWQQFVTLGSTNAKLWTAYGESQRLLSRADSAKATFERALELDPASFAAAQGHVRVLLAMRLGTDAVAEAKAVSARLPENRDALMLLGGILLQTGRFAEAVEPYDEALRRKPDDPSALFGRAMANRGTGASAAAERDLTAFLKAPRCESMSQECVVMALVARAQIRHAADRNDEALQDMDAAQAKVSEVFGPAEMNWPPDVRRILALRAELERVVGHKEDAVTQMLALAQKSGIDGVLRLQLRLRQAGYRDLQLTGQLDAATTEAVKNCNETPDCKVLRSL